MKNVLFRAFFLLLVVVGIGACTTKPIYTAQGVHFGSPDAPLSERANQIRRAAAGRGWSVEDVAPGQIRATINLRESHAVVAINFTRTHFSINYVDSRNLEYNGKEIHRSYNGWVQNLEHDIIAQSSV